MSLFCQQFSLLESNFQRLRVRQVLSAAMTTPWKNVILWATMCLSEHVATLNSARSMPITPMLPANVLSKIVLSNRAYDLHTRPLLGLPSSTTCRLHVLLRKTLNQGHTSLKVPQVFSSIASLLARGDAAENKLRCVVPKTLGSKSKAVAILKSVAQNTRMLVVN